MTRWLADILYLLLATLTAPLWLWRLARRGKLRTDWPARLGRGRPLPPSQSPTILVHAVSVGEVNAIRLLVRTLDNHPVRPRVVIATTTDTGLARATALFAPQHHVVRYPFDFNFAVRRFLDLVRPDAVALVELELWPNFTAACQRRRVPVCVVNGRLSDRSFRRYRHIAALVRPSFRRLAFAAVQNADYARRFIKLGMPESRVHVTDTMKWDTAEISDTVDGADALADELGIDRSRPLVVGGSTAPQEHALLRDAVPEGVQLLCAPRRPEWFDDAAAALAGCARRSRGDCGSAAGRFLLDTIGELRKAYALADVVVVGRTFGQLHGSDMMEPIALGKPTIIGPAVSDFQQTADALLAGGGVVQSTAADLPKVLRELLDDPRKRAELAERGRAVIRDHQGATARHAELIVSLLSPSADESRAASGRV